MKKPSLNDLTPRELKVLYWLAEGKSIWETATILSCSCGAVKKHRGRIYQTLGVGNSGSAINFYRQAIIIQAGQKDPRHVSLCPACLGQLVLSGSFSGENDAA